MKRLVDEKMIKDYLLGILPEAETERLDEMSLADDDFATSLETAECDLVDSYIKGELSPDENDRFKSNYLASPTRRKKVDFARTFHARLQQEQPSMAGTTWKSRAARIFTLPNLKLQWGFAAAALLLLLAVGALILSNLRLRNQIQQTQAEHRQLKQRQQEWQNRMSQRRSARGRSDSERSGMQQKIEDLEQQLAQQKQEIPPQTDVQLLAFNLSPQPRGISKLPVLSIPEQTDFVTLKLELEVNEFSAYYVALKGAGTDEILWRSGKIKVADESNSVLVGLPANIFTEQNYLLELSGVSASGPEVISGYPFRVVSP